MKCFCVRKIPLGHQPVNNLPRRPGLRQHRPDSFFPHRVNGGDTQDVFFDIAGKGIALIADQVFHLFHFAGKELICPVEGCFIRDSLMALCGRLICRQMPS